MNAGGVGKLERVALREVWKHEAYDFTHWLQENIDLPNEALDITLVNVDREQASGSFSADLVAEDDGGGKGASDGAAGEGAPSLPQDIDRRLGGMR